MRSRVALLSVVLASCGRVGFDATRDATGTVPVNDGSSATGDAPTPSPITWVHPFVQAESATLAAVQTFSAAATAAGDAIAVHVFCRTDNATAVTLTAPGWSFTNVGGLTGSTIDMGWAASFGAIAPDTDAATFTVTWTIGAGCQNSDAIGDEFTGNDPTGGEVTFDAHGENFATTGDCTVEFLTADADEELWSACTSGSDVLGPGSGFIVGADDLHGDITARRSSTDPAGTLEMIDMPNTPTYPFLVTAIAIKPL